MFVSVSTPRGFTTLTTFGMWLYVPVVSRTFMESKLYAFDLEEQYIKDTVKGNLAWFHFLHSILTFNIEKGYQTAAQTEALNAVQTARASFKNSTLHPIIRNVCFIYLNLFIYF